MIWIVIFMMFLLVGQFFDNLILLSVTFFLLVLVACEMSQGLLLLNFKYTLERSISFFNSDRGNGISKFNSTRHSSISKK